MRNPLFGDTVTLYHRQSTGWQRTVLAGVQWKQTIRSTSDSNGKMQLATVTSVTIPAAIPAEISADGQDVMVLGIGPALSDTYTLANLRREYPSYCTVRAVADNTLRPRLKHRKVTAV